MRHLCGSCVCPCSLHHGIRHASARQERRHPSSAAASLSFLPTMMPPPPPPPPAPEIWLFIVMVESRSPLFWTFPPPSQVPNRILAHVIGQTRTPPLQRASRNLHRIQRRDRRGLTDGRGLEVSRIPKIEIREFLLFLRSRIRIALKGGPIKLGS